MGITEYLLLFGGGLLAGIMNTLAGNGSAITLSLLIFLGLPPNVANATNRIGAMVQTITAVLSVRKTPRTKFMFKETQWFFIPSLIGSTLGAFLAVKIDPGVLEFMIGIIMLLLLATLLNKPKKWLKATNLGSKSKTLLNWFLIFLIGLYGGFLQMGIGIMILSVLVLLMQYSLKDGNIIKLLLAMVFLIPAFFVFLGSGEMQWKPGVALACGQAIGAVIGARYILFLPKANTYVRWLLIVILSISSIVMLQLHTLLFNLFQ